MAKKPDQSQTWNLPEYFGEEKTYPNMDGSYRGMLGSDGKYRVAWKPPVENLAEGQNAEYGSHIQFENDGFDNQQDVYDFLDWQYGDRPATNLDELEKFDKFMDLEQIGDQEKMNLAYLLNVAKNYPDQLQDELGSMSGELLKNPIVQQIIKKYSRKK
jgi:hypothetical protein